MIRQDDIEQLKRKAVMEGRPMKSDIIRDKSGKLITFSTDKKGRVRITNR